jgi:hypothetical protein
MMLNDWRDFYIEEVYKGWTVLVKCHDPEASHPYEWTIIEGTWQDGPLSGHGSARRHADPSAHRTPKDALLFGKQAVDSIQEHYRLNSKQAKGVCYEDGVPR